MPVHATKKMDILSRRIPRNPKFDFIEPTIDTGASLSKKLKDWEEFKEDYKINKDEIYKRIKPVDFVKLIIQLAEMQKINNYESNSLDTSDNLNNNDAKVDNKKSSFEKFVSGHGEINGKDYSNKSQVNNQSVSKTPYLLLDVRKKEDFDTGHIIKGHHYPAAMLGRSCNFETPEMLYYKNRPGSIIIVYDNDETIASRVSTTLVERGYENVLMLSGGLKVCWKKFPRGLIAGAIPIELQKGILATCGLSNYQKMRSSDSVEDLSRGVGRMSCSGDDGMSTRSICTMRSSISRFTSRRRFDVHDFVPYCDVNSRRRPDLDDEEEFTVEDLAHLSLAIDQSETASTRTKSCSRASMSSFRMRMK